jgi:hypothetical protein
LRHFACPVTSDCFILVFLRVCLNVYQAACLSVCLPKVGLSVAVMRCHRCHMSRKLQNVFSSCKGCPASPWPCMIINNMGGVHCQQSGSYRWP